MKKSLSIQFLNIFRHQVFKDIEFLYIKFLKTYLKMKLLNILFSTYLDIKFLNKKIFLTKFLNKHLKHQVLNII